MTPKTASKTSSDAKLFWNGRSQAVRLPKEFRFEGDRVRISRVGKGVLLEPVKVQETREERIQSIEQWFAELDAIGAEPLFPEGRKQNLTPVREYFK